MRASLIALALLAPPSALAITEDGYPEHFDSEVRPYYFDGRKTGFITGVDGVKLSFVAFEREPELGAFIFLPGRGGSHVQAMELFHDMREWGYSVYALDERGQGMSERLVDNKYKGHVDSFQFYVDDVKTFLDEVVNQRRHEKVFLAGISMGGAIATAYAEQHPGDIDGLVLFVPMHEPNWAPFGENGAAAIALAGVSTGQAEEYAITQGDPDPDEKETFEENRGTGSRVRWEQEVRFHDEFPETVLGGITYGWAHEVVRATRKLRKEVKRLTMPVLLFQAGQDVVVVNGAQDAVCNAAPDCTLRAFADAHHGILSETDAIRTPLLEEMHAFLDEHAGRGVSCSVSRANHPSSMLVLLGLMVMLRFRRH